MFEALFPDPSQLAAVPLLFLLLVYGSILLRASQLMGDGCEMLLLLYGPGLIGGLVIPILGAVPDCVVILISGLGQGTQEEIQDELNVGVGTLVGSTVMLLTLPWAAGVVLGRHDYDPVTGEAASTARGKPKYTSFSWNNCVTTLPDIPWTARIMMLSALTYMFVQIPAWFLHQDGERYIALFGMIIAALGCASYCWTQIRSSTAEDMQRLQHQRALMDQWKRTLGQQVNLRDGKYQEMIFHSHDLDKSGYIEAPELAAALADLGLKVQRRDVQDIMRSIDVGHSADQDSGVADGRVSLNEFKAAVSLWIKSGQNTDEFNKLVVSTSSAPPTTGDHPALDRKASTASSLTASPASLATTLATPLLDADYAVNVVAHANGKGVVEDDAKSSDGSDSSIDVAAHDENEVEDAEDDNDDEDEEGEEGEHWELTDRELRLKAFGILAFATIVITFFSDPMVDVITNLGRVMNVSPFYISFVVTPMASNASEVVAGILFARKKTSESISMTLASLHGAATLNSTLGLCIFLALVYFRQLAWQFTSEVLCVFFVVVLVGVQAMHRTTLYVWQAALVASLYPLAIVFVFVMDTYAGWK